MPAATAPTTEPTPPVRAMPPSTMAATLLRVALAPTLKRGSPRAGDGGGGQPGEGGEGAADGVGDDLGPGGVDPGQIGGVAIAAGGVQRQPGSRPAHAPGDHDDRDHEHHQGRPEVAADPRSGEPVKMPRNPSLVPPPGRGQHDQGEPGQDEARGQGHHDVGHPETVDDPADAPFTRAAPSTIASPITSVTAQRLSVHEPGGDRSW